MRTILESNIQDLKNDPQFQYDLNRMKDVIRSNNPTTSEADVEKNAIEALKTEIIDRNHEASGTQIEVDPYYMNELKYNQEKEAMALRQQYAKDLEDYKTDSSIREYKEKAKIDQQYPKPSKSSSSRENPDGSESTGDYMGARMEQGVNNYYAVNAGGKQDMIAALKATQDTFRASGVSYQSARDSFLENNTIKNQFDPQTIIHGIADTKDVKGDMANTIYLSEGKLRDVYTDDDVTLRTLGVPYGDKDFKDRQKKPKYSKNLYMEVVGDGITLPGKDNRIHQYVKVHVYDGGYSGDTGDLGYMWFEYQSGMENAASTRKNKANGVTHRLQNRPFQYEWGQENWGKYNPIHVKTEKYLGNNKPDRVGE